MLNWKVSSVQASFSYLADGHRDGRALVGAIIRILTDESQEVVLDTDERDRVVGSAALLQDDRSRSSCRKREGESVSLGSQFLQQAILGE